MARVHKDDLPYRTCVGIMLINRAGLVWIGRRRPKWGDTPIWQMPQGGVVSRETTAAAAMRELEEETGVRNAEIVAEAPDWISYDLPPKLVGVALKGRYRGQRQKWFALRFKGDDREISITPRRRGLKSEFDAWRWAYAADAVDLAIDFKQPLYREVAALFADYVAAPGKAPPRSVSPARLSWRERILGRGRAAALHRA